MNYFYLRLVYWIEEVKVYNKINNKRNIYYPISVGFRYTGVHVRCREKACKYHLWMIYFSSTQNEALAIIHLQKIRQVWWPGRVWVHKTFPVLFNGHKSRLVSITESCPLIGCAIKGHNKCCLMLLQNINSFSDSKLIAWLSKSHKDLPSFLNLKRGLAVNGLMLLA